MTRLLQTQLKPFLLSLIAVSAVFCGLVTFDVNPKPIEFEIKDTENLVYQKDKLLDVSTNSTYTQYKDKIRTVTIKKLSYVITGTPVSATQVLTSATIKVASVAGGDQVTLATLSNINLTEAIAAGAQNLQTDASAVKRFVELIKAEGKAQLYITAAVNEKNVDIKIALTPTFTLSI